MSLTANLWLAALLCFITPCARSQDALAGLHLPFDDNRVGEAPAQIANDNLALAGAVRVVDADSDPSDPFGGTNNRSLLMDKPDEGTAPVAIFRTEGGYTQGQATIRYYPDMGASKVPTRSFVHLQGNGEIAVIFQIIGGKPSYIGSDDNRARNFDQVGRTTEANDIVLVFDLAKAVFRGSLNGEPLSIKGETEFPLRAVPADINEISLKVSTTKGPAARAFFDDITLTEIPASRSPTKP